MPLINITLVKLRGVERQLRRLNDLLEVYLKHCGIGATKPQEVAVGDAEVSYVDDELEWVKDQLMRAGKLNDEEWRELTREEE